jgi:uracil-DNA glycosylase family 4
MSGQAFTGGQGAFLKSMLEDAGLTGMRFYFINCILCRPCNKKGGETRDPAPEELLGCRDMVLEMIDAACAKHVVFAGDIAKKNFKKVFPHAVAIPNLTYLIRLGGKRAPNYYDCIARLSRFCAGR